MVTACRQSRCRRQWCCGAAVRPLRAPNAAIADGALSRIKQSDLIDLTYLVGGYFNHAFRAVWRSRQKDVVIKVPNSATASENEQILELGMFLRIPVHRNIVAVLGVMQSFEWYPPSPSPSATVATAAAAASHAPRESVR